MSCPKCGNNEVVSKAEAWDALTKIPPRTEKQIAWLVNVKNAAAEIVTRGIVNGDKNTVVCTIRVSDLESLQEAFRQNVNDT